MLAENVANADTPGFQPRDLAPPKIEPGKPAAAATVGFARTHPAHFASAAGGNQFPLDRNGGFEARPSGNAVSSRGRDAEGRRATRWTTRRRPRSTPAGSACCALRSASAEI